MSAPVQAVHAIRVLGQARIVKGRIAWSARARTQDPPQAALSQCLAASPRRRDGWRAAIVIGARTRKSCGFSDVRDAEIDALISQIDHAFTVA